MKTLIAISSCHDYEARGINNTIRETWMKDLSPELGLDVKFFVGRGYGDVKPDTVALACDDTYDAMTWKTLRKLQWAVEHDYDHVFCACADTYIRPERLAACGFENFDSLGAFISIGPSGKFVNGGCGYFLSALAAKMVLAGPKPVGKQATTFEDCFITSRLKYLRDLRISDDPSIFVMQGTGPRSWNDVVTRHLHFRVYDEIVFSSQLVRDEHRSWMDSLHL